jgi:hypothetical protein
MIKISSYLDGKYKSHDIGKVNLKPGDLITSPKHHFMGIMLEREFVAINVKYFYSFRFKLQNKGYLENVKVLCWQMPLDVAILESYFSQNNDNPYAVQHVMNCIYNKFGIDHLTQFPPLYLKKDENSQRQAIELMFNKANLGDTVFTYDRQSGISRLIRKIDQGHWSHAGIVDKDRNIVEMTTTGFIKSTFLDLCSPSIDIGLYRIRGLNLNSEQAEAIQKVMDGFLKNQFKFDWFGIFIVFLHKKIGLPIKHPPTPADLVYSNKYELVAYA